MVVVVRLAVVVVVVVQVNQVRARMLRQYLLVVGLVCRVGFVLVSVLVQVPVLVVMVGTVIAAVGVLEGQVVLGVVKAVQVRLAQHLHDHLLLVQGLLVQGLP